MMSVIETLLCYLELHSKKWIENLQPIFANCSVQFYGGRAQMLAVAKKVSVYHLFVYSWTTLCPEKRRHCIFDYNCRISRWIFIIFIYLETGMNTP